MLTWASFQNFKLLKQVEVDLSRLTLLVGKNGSGKSSILQALHYLSETGERGEGEVKSLPDSLKLLFGGPRELRRHATLPERGPISIAMRDEEGRMLKVESQPRKEVQPRLSLSWTDTGGTRAISLPGESIEKFLALYSEPSVRRFAAALFLHLDANVMIKPSVAESEQPRFEHDGEGLASVLNYFAGAEPAILEALTEDLRKVVPEVRGIRTFPASLTRRRQERIVIGDQAVNRSFEEQVWGHRFALDMGRGRIVQADALSEGTVLSLGLLAALRHPQCPRLVLADDIDRALHPAAQAELVQCIRAILAARPDLQMVCTTHSPDLLDHVQPEEVRVLALDAEGYAVCRKLSDHPELHRWRDMLRTGEFWASVGEEWVSEVVAHDK